MNAHADRVAAFIDAACVPLDASHASGTLDRAEAILAEHPAIASVDIHTAAILGDDAAVRRFIEANPASATAKRGPRGWDALTHLCFSRYVRLRPEKSAGFVNAARALLDAGANANTGWYEQNHQPKPEWEPALYGAAGIAHHAELTRLLLERGANPNDEEVVYHTPETYDNRALELLVETGKLTDESLSLMLIRKLDWHDYDGAKYLLEHGAVTNRMRERGWVPLHHSLARDNRIEIIALLLEHDADPTAMVHGSSAIAVAARRGRGDVLELLERRGPPVALTGVDRLIAAAAKADPAIVQDIAKEDPRLVRELLAYGGALLVQFAGNGNTGGVRHLLDLGVDVGMRFKEGDGYWDVPPNSTALHAAAWRAQHDTVKLLIERGAPINARDGRGRTPLARAVSACVDSYWTERRSPESVRALLDAGASPADVKYPSGYAEVDDLLKARGR